MVELSSDVNCRTARWQVPIERAYRCHRRSGAPNGNSAGGGIVLASGEEPVHQHGGFFPGELLVVRQG
jgi:hypothetical protein